VSSTVVRSKIEESTEPVEQPKAAPEIASDHKETEDKIDPPFTDYEMVKHRPYSVEYFDIGPFWEDKMGSYKPEIDQIEGYIVGRIREGKLDNTIKAVKQFYKQMEKLSGIDKTERTVVRIAKIASYIKFLKEADHINMDSYKYA
jgi:hypothetical protein